MKIKPSDKSGGVVVELSASESQMPMAGDEPAVKALTEFRLKRILVPVDFSICSQKALQYAVPFARQFDAKLELLYVLGTYVPVPEIPAVSLDYSQTELLTTAQNELKALRRTLPGDVESEIVVREGSAHIEIVNEAKKSGVDLIILSTHGHTGMAHVFLGSTSERVVRYTPCPVLVVRESEHEFVAGRPAGAAK